MVSNRCPFCNLGPRIIKENKNAVLFLSNPRKMKGHCLVTPKRHVEKPWELTAIELSDIYQLIYFAQKLLIQQFGGGCDIRQNYRPFLKQGRLKVDHVHYHIMPRTNEDKLYQAVEKHETAIFEQLSNNEQNEISRVFKSTSNEDLDHV